MTFSCRIAIPVNDAEITLLVDGDIERPDEDCGVFFASAQPHTVTLEKTGTRLKRISQNHWDKITELCDEEIGLFG